MTLSRADETLFTYVKRLRAYLGLRSNESRDHS